MWEYPTWEISNGPLVRVDDVFIAKTKNVRIPNGPQCHQGQVPDQKPGRHPHTPLVRGTPNPLVRKPRQRQTALSTGTSLQVQAPSRALSESEDDDDLERFRGPLGRGSRARVTFFFAATTDRDHCSATLHLCQNRDLADAVLSQCTH